MILKVEHLETISDKLMRSKNCFDLEPIIESSLSKATSGKYSFKVNFVKVNPRETPFIMCVYPDPELLSQQTNQLLEALNDKSRDRFITLWRNFHHWVIEIDTRIVDPSSKLCVDDGQQFVAMLCHEIGHVMNIHPCKLYYNYYMNKAKMDMYEKMVMGNRNYIWKVFLPMFVCIDGFRVITRSPIRFVSEIRADLYIPTNYADALLEYIERHILTNPDTAHGIVLTNEESDCEYQKGVEFSRECIRLMKARRSILKAHVATQYKLSSSQYFKRIYKIVHDAITGDDIITGKSYPNKDRFISYKVDAVHKSMSQESELILESKVVTDRDITLLMVETDAIETYDDKSFVLNTIFDYIEILQRNEAKLLKKTKGDVTTVLNPYKQKIKQLQDLKVEVMNKKITPPTYGVYIKYPEGYEG